MKLFLFYLGYFILLIGSILYCSAKERRNLQSEIQIWKTKTFDIWEDHISILNIIAAKYPKDTSLRELLESQEKKRREYLQGEQGGR